jgi:amylovoran biosynthesis glycosyltransferase AmsD
LIEAKSFGVASVAFDCRTGPAEIIEDGEDGFLIPFGDDAFFSERLQCLMTNKDKLFSMQHNALKNAKKFSMQAVGKSWENLLNSEF